MGEVRESARITAFDRLHHPGRRCIWCGKISWFSFYVSLRRTTPISENESLLILARSLSTAISLASIQNLLSSDFLDEKEIVSINIRYRRLRAFPYTIDTRYGLESIHLFRRDLGRQQGVMDRYRFCFPIGDTALYARFLFHREMQRIESKYYMRRMRDPCVKEEKCAYMS